MSRAKPSRPGRRAAPSLFARLVGRFERSQNVFLAGLVVAFAVEIMVDWNSTFYEINVLRGGLREKATNYAAMLRVAAQDPLSARDVPRLKRLCHRVLVDDEISHVRVTTTDGNALVEAGSDLLRRFPKQVLRDEKAMLADADGLRRAIAESTHSDIFQKITDGEDRLLRAVFRTAPPPLPRVEQEIAYQDRLYNERVRDERQREEDRSVTWAVATVDAPRKEGGKPIGVVLIALKTDRLNAAIRNKLYKGAAVTLFFLGVILIQQLAARRAKMRLLSMSDALHAAREALAASLPPALPEIAGVEGALAFEQAERLGGTVYDFHVDPAQPHGFDVFLALPEGSGVDVAFASLILRERQKRLYRDRRGAPSEELLTTLLAGYRDEPISRRVQLALFRVDLEKGEVRGVVAGLDPPAILDREGIPLLPEVAPLGELPGAELVDGSLRRFRTALPAGATLLLLSDGLPIGATHPLPPALAVERVREAANRPIAELVEALHKLALRRVGKALSDDLLIAVLRRA